METQTHTPQEFFNKILPARFKPEKAEGVNTTVQLNVSGPQGGNWFIAIKDKKMDITEDTHLNADLTLKMGLTDFLDMVNGKLSAEKAFFTGKIQFKGNIAVALKLRDTGFL